MELVELRGSVSPEIKGIAYNSLKVEPGFLFVAIRGLKEDGHNFIEEAVGKGAQAVVMEIPKPEFNGATRITVPDSRKALALLSARFYGDPSEGIKLIGITGTNGKTTTAYLTESILKQNGYRVGVIGTIKHWYPEKVLTAQHTTPESWELQGILREMADHRVDCAVMEVSSHALNLRRVDGCQFDVGLFTNISQDHLDYHGSMEDYFASKQKFFLEKLPESRKQNKWAIFNLDDPWVSSIGIPPGLKPLRFGRKEGAEVTAQNARLSLEGIRAKLKLPQGNLEISSSLLGEFNLSNIMAATAVGVSLKIPREKIRKGIKAALPIPGRMERVANKRGINIFVDYAHTPQALQSVLESLSGLTPGRIITVFGCGGDRDQSKRPLMGEISARLSDLTIITSDNPRGEDPDRIISDISQGTESVLGGHRQYSPRKITERFKTKGYLTVADRKEAIRMAVAVARKGDSVLIAGKGHEHYQIVGNKQVLFDDAEQVREAFKSLNHHGKAESR
ncbi:MAG: UDP-N-acetylmuramoyl-L-alanyl-D-glutamate--2,6-diaminopimelate ligase [Deltaproteobacteria bacterium]|nr:MAG: UDP-N-acetylmuramoyl-L-alanyl-D-glutamate--2,6-diaminopimelate ligase [Deltaproteobacteria bacterium]